MPRVNWRNSTENGEKILVSSANQDVDGNPCHFQVVEMFIERIFCHGTFCYVSWHQNYLFSTSTRLCTHWRDAPIYDKKNVINSAGSSSFVTIHKLSFQLDPTTRLFLTFMAMIVNERKNSLKIKIHLIKSKMMRKVSSEFPSDEKLVQGNSLGGLKFTIN